MESLKRKARDALKAVRARMTGARPLAVRATEIAVDHGAVRRELDAAVDASLEPNERILLDVYAQTEIPKPTLWRLLVPRPGSKDVVEDLSDFMEVGSGAIGDLGMGVRFLNSSVPLRVSVTASRVLLATGTLTKPVAVTAAPRSRVKVVQFRRPHGMPFGKPYVLILDIEERPRRRLKLVGALEGDLADLVALLRAA